MAFVAEFDAHFANAGIFIVYFTGGAVVHVLRNQFTFPTHERADLLISTGSIGYRRR